MSEIYATTADQAADVVIKVGPYAGQPGRLSGFSKQLNMHLVSVRNYKRRGIAFIQLAARKEELTWL